MCHSFITHSTADGLLGWSHFLAVLNCYEHGGAGTPVKKIRCPLVYAQGLGIDCIIRGSSSSSLRSLSTDFHSCTSLPFSQQWMSIPFPTPSASIYCCLS